VKVFDNVDVSDADVSLAGDVICDVVSELCCVEASFVFVVIETKVVDSRTKFVDDVS
jgi:hypothetical protein